jgi:CBS domain-containing protein
VVTVNQLLNKKGNDIWSIAPDASVFEALQLMADKNVGALLVLENGDLKGIFSERDYARKLILQGKFSKKTAVSELMTQEVVCVDSSRTIEDCMALMTARRIRHLPVLRGDELIGIVTIGDVVRQLIDHHQFVIEQLERYITGT